jgi:regulator of protease activity HflC (stomatin/prohibitin superfamily)
MNQLFQWLTDLFRGARPWVIVLAWERGVRARLGKNTTILEPGFHWRIPWLDEVRMLNNRLRITSFPCVTVSTRDGRAITCAGNIGFRIADPRAALLAMSSPDNVLTAVGQSIAARLIAEGPTPASLSVAAIEAAALEELRAFVEGKGLHIESFRLVDFAQVRAFRLLQEDWRPNSKQDEGHS